MHLNYTVTPTSVQHNFFKIRLWLWDWILLFTETCLSAALWAASRWRHTLFFLCFHHMAVFALLDWRPTAVQQGVSVLFFLQWWRRCVHHKPNSNRSLSCCSGAAQTVMSQSCCCCTLLLCITWRYYFYSCRGGRKQQTLTQLLYLTLRYFYEYEYDYVHFNETFTFIYLL